MRYEYIKLEFDFGDLAELNKLGRGGWRVVTVQSLNSSGDGYVCVALLERSLEFRSGT